MISKQLKNKNELAVPDSTILHQKNVPSCKSHIRILIITRDINACSDLA